MPDDRFDVMIARLEAAGVTYFADPGHTHVPRMSVRLGCENRTQSSPTARNAGLVRP